WALALMRSLTCGVTRRVMISVFFSLCIDAPFSPSGAGGRGSAPELRSAYSRTRCLPSRKGGIRISGPGRISFHNSIGRVDGDGVSGSGIIDTIGPFQADEPLPVALSEAHHDAAPP